MSASRSLSPLKTSPSMMFKTPSLVNISGDPDAESEKDVRIRELEETIMALRSELTSIRSQPERMPRETGEPGEGIREENGAIEERAAEPE